MMPDKSAPHITNLSEDQQMSGMVYYSVAKGELSFGRKTANPIPDVILGAIGIKQNHAKIRLTPKGLFKIEVYDAESAANTLINGEAIPAKLRGKILNHCDRISFAGGNIYVFKYPKLRRAIKRMIDENELTKAGGLDKKDQEEIAWKTIQEQGILDVDKSNLSTLLVTDYSDQEKKEDENAVDWDIAFDEIENGEKIKQERIKKEREDLHNAELEKQK